MADDVNVKIKITSDGEGANKAEKGLERVKETAKKTSSGSAAAMGKVTQSLGGVEKACGLLKKAFAGFGVAALVMSITSGLSTIMKSFKEAEKAADDFKKINDKLAKEISLNQLINDYNALKTAIVEANKATQDELNLIDQNVSARRRLAQAKLNADKEAELSALNPADKDYEEKRAAIERKYNRRAAGENSLNAVEDLVLKRQKLDKQADATDKEADAMDKEIEILNRKKSAAQGKKDRADIEANELNDEDKTDFLSGFAKTTKQLVTLDWGRAAGAKTKEGDAIRKEAAQRAAEHEKEIQAIDAEIAQVKAAQEAKRQSAKNLRDQSDAMGGEIEAAQLEGETAIKAARREDVVATKQTGIKNAKEAQERRKEAAKEADAREAIRRLDYEKTEKEARRSELEQKKREADEAVYLAQGRVETARLGGNRSEQLAAQEELNKANENAQNVGFAVERELKKLNDYLKSIESNLKAASSYLDSKSSQEHYAWNESPAGV